MRAGVWTAPQVEPHWQEERRFRPRSSRPYRLGTSKNQRPPDTVTPDEVCSLMRRWGR